jgi:uncharacterized membrane protein
MKGMYGRMFSIDSPAPAHDFCRKGKACHECKERWLPYFANDFCGAGHDTDSLPGLRSKAYPSRHRAPAAPARRAHELVMRLQVEKQHSNIAAVVFDLLNPIPYAFFVAALIFDVVYANSADVLWLKSAAWLICSGLVFAVLPRLINLVRVWLPGRRPRPFAEKAAFWLHLLAIVAATVNAFVHSRDAYAAIPDGVWLSILTVALIVIGNVFLTLQQPDAKE